MNCTNGDITFGNASIVQDSFVKDNQGRILSSDVARTLLPQPNGTILVAGSSDPDQFGPESNSFAIARYNKNGSPDNSFGKEGKATFSFKRQNGVSPSAIVKLLQQADGKIIAVGIAGESLADPLSIAITRHFIEATPLPDPNLDPNPDPTPTPGGGSGGCSLSAIGNFHLFQLLPLLVVIGYWGWRKRKWESS